MVHLRRVALPKWIIDPADDSVPVAANISCAGIIDRGNIRYGKASLFLELLPPARVVSILVEVSEHRFHVRVRQPLPFHRPALSTVQRFHLCARIPSANPPDLRETGQITDCKRLAPRVGGDGIVKIGRENHAARFSPRLSPHQRFRQRQVDSHYKVRSSADTYPMTSAAKWAILERAGMPDSLLSASANNFSIRALRSFGFDACITASRISSGSSGKSPAAFWVWITRSSIACWPARPCRYRQREG